MATFGGLWQAVVFGFAGVRPNEGVLRVEPALPRRWSHLRIRVRFQGIAVRLDLGHDRVVIEADGPVSLSVYGIAVRGSAEFVRQRDVWRQQ